MPASLGLGQFWRRQVLTALHHASIIRTSPSPSVRFSIFHLHPSTSARIRTTRTCPRRFQSTESKPPSLNPQSPNPNPTTTTTDPATARQVGRVSRILTSASRFLPARLRASLHNLRSAPISHIIAFLVLHEITAIAPIFALTYTFHVMDWVPTSWVLGPWASWAEDGLKKYVPYFRKKHWFGLQSGDGEQLLESELKEEARKEREHKDTEGKKGWFSKYVGKGDADTSSSTALSKEVADESKKGKATAAWQKVKQVATVDNTGKGYKIGIQIAAAYTITKFLLVPRIALSLWLTPGLARAFLRIRKRF